MSALIGLTWHLNCLTYIDRLADQIVSYSLPVTDPPEVVIFHWSLSEIKHSKTAEYKLSTVTACESQSRSVA